MSPRLTIAAGLIAGMLVAVALLVSLVAFVPDPGAPTPPALLVPTTGLSSTSPGTSLAGGVPPSPSASAGSANFHVGEPAPALVVPQMGGGTIDLAGLRGKPVWVNFMGSYCPPCRDELPLMNGFAARYADTGLVVLAIDVREDEGTVAAFIQSLDVRFPVGRDADGTAQEAWQAIALPVHFWVDATGIIRDGALGGIGPDIMAAGLSTILPGVVVTP
jgi:thiol-disulfide isomerase/thioredoxin